MKHGFKIDDQINDTGFSCLSYAAAYQKSHRKVFDAILAFGPDVNHANRMHKKTALHLAAHCNNLLAIDVLLKQPGVYLNPKSCGLDTPLHYAVRVGSIEAIRALMTANACPMCKNMLDQTVLDLAQVIQRSGEKRDTDFVSLINNQVRFRVSALVESVIQHGVRNIQQSLDLLTP